MKKLTDEKAIELHRQLWNWIAKTNRAKRQWPGWTSVLMEYGRIINDCFACTVACRRAKCEKVTIDNDVCNHCLFDWSEGGRTKAPNCEDIYPGGQGLHYLWVNAVDDDDAKEFALRIANLPLKTEKDG